MNGKAFRNIKAEAQPGDVILYVAANQLVNLGKKYQNIRHTAD